MKKLAPVLIAAAILLVLGGVVLVRRQSQKQTATFSNKEETSLTSGAQSAISPSAAAGGKTVNLTVTPTLKEITSTSISLTVSSPSGNTTVTKSLLTVKGKTSAKAEVYINEVETVADTNGNFSGNINLDEGENLVIITVIDGNGNSAEKEFVITYDAGE